MDVAGCELWCNRTLILIKYKARSQVPLKAKICELLCHKSLSNILGNSMLAWCNSLLKQTKQTKPKYKENSGIFFKGLRYLKEVTKPAYWIGYL